MSSFSSLVPRDVFQSGILSDQSKIDLKEYFVAVKTRFESGEEFPYNLDELIPAVFASKQKATDALIRDFTQDIDFTRSTVRLTDNPTPREDYFLSPLAFEFMVARKHKEIFALYHTVFHMHTGGKSTEQPKPTPAIHALEDGMRLLAQAKTFAIEVIGLVGNQALLSANQATYKALGVNVLEHFDQKALPADKRGQTFTQTQLGECFFKYPINARKIGILLNNAGLQNRVGGRWHPTDKAAGLYEWLDTSKQHNSGTPIKQLKWFKEVLDHPDFVTALLPLGVGSERIN